MDHPREIANLFSRYLNSECTPEEVQHLLTYFDAAENEGLFKRLIRAELEDISYTDPGTASGKLDNILKMIKKRMKKN